MTKRTCALAAVVLAGLAGPRPCAGQVKAGGEIQVNTYTLGDQQDSSIAADARGNFVVVWADLVDGTVKGQRFNRAGSRVGPEFTVSAAAEAYGPEVMMRRQGDFVVVWALSQDGSATGIRARRFDAAANPLGAELQVNAYTTGFQVRPALALDGQGNIVVAWTSRGQKDGAGYGIFAQRFDSRGNRRGDEFLVNTYTTGDQNFPDVSSDPAGNFVIAWTATQSVPPSTTTVVAAQRYDGSGAPLGGNFLVNSSTTSQQNNPVVAHAPDGAFVVVYMGSGLSAQRFDPSGSPIGGEFNVSGTMGGLQQAPQIAMDTQGNFVLGWGNSAGDGSGGSMGARRFRADGTARGLDFIVNTYTLGNQVPSRFASSVISDEVGNVTFTWRSPQVAGGGVDVLAQRFGGLYPEALQVDAAGNNVLEAGEVAEVQPTWRNLAGGPRTFAATVSSFTGPAGPIYTLFDGVGDYGTVADGAAAPCTDCYTVQVTGTRPAPHWDAVAVEAITPDAQGQQKGWKLHVGGSFTDVPTSSPFYRFVETMLHYSVTGGCTASQYCPGDSTTRAQMAVFALLAKEGAGYLPPACTTPVFNDVTATNPFCRFIEELARRGVVSGCGGSNYCPDVPVTRAQMSVFALRALDPALNPPACTFPIFADVPASSPFCRWIAELARRGVVSGCGGGNYCPDDAVTRQQMSVFIAVTFGLTLYGP